MKTYRNIGASPYRRWNNQVVQHGEAFIVSEPKELGIIETEGAVGIRLEEITPEGAPLAAVPQAPAAAGTEAPAGAQADEKADEKSKGKGTKKPKE